MKKHLLKQIMNDEGLRLEPYKDTVGKLTIGYGRNLDDVGISEAEAEYLLRSDLRRTINNLDSKLSWWRNLTRNRQCAIANMCFNLGVGGLLTFEKMLEALKEKDYPLAADEALDSLWAKQVGDRAKRIADLIRHG